MEPNTASAKRTASVAILHSDGRALGHIIVNQCAINGEIALESTTSSKNSFFPLFTATWCPFSPDMDRTLTEIQKRWKHPIIPMRIHIKDSDLYTPLSVEFSELYDNWSTPTGYVENIFKVENLSDGNVSVDNFWNLVMVNTTNNPDYTNTCAAIGCKSILSDNEITADITLRPRVQGKYRLLVFVVEDNISCPQMSKPDGEIQNYCHNGILVGALTKVTGQEFDLTTQQKVISMSGSISQNYNPSNLRLLVVLERNSANLNYSDECWYADNCLSAPLGKATDTGKIEKIYVGEEIKN